MKKREAILFLFTLSTFNTLQQTAIQMPAILYPHQSHPHIEPVSPVPAVTEEKGRSNAEMLREFRGQKGNFALYLESWLKLNSDSGIFYLNESLLIRDTLYLMQGISGKYVKFSSSTEDDKRLVFPSDLVRS